MLLLFSSLVSAGSLIYTFDSHSLNSGVNGFEHYDGYIYYNVGGTQYRVNETFEDETVFSSTGGAYHGFGITNVDTTYSQLRLSAQGGTTTNIRQGSTGLSGVTTTDISNDMPLDNIATDIIDIALYNDDDFVLLGDTGSLYFYEINEAGVGVDFFFLYDVELSNLIETNFTNADIEYDGTYIWYLDADDTIYQYDKTGGLVEEYEIPLLTDPSRLFLYNDDMYIFDEDNDFIYGFDISMDGTGNNETFLLGGQEYSYSLCIDDQTLCDNVTYVLVGGEPQFYCQKSTDATFCSDSCTNVESNDVLTGQCTQLGCTNECAVEGQQLCTTSGTYSICGNFDSDACLEYGTVFFCPANSYCTQDNYNTQCTNVSSTGSTYTQDFITVDLSLFSNSGTQTAEGVVEVPRATPEVKSISYEPLWTPIIDPLGLGTAIYNQYKQIRASSFETSLDVIETGFAFTSFETSGQESGFYAYSCDYRESIQVADDLSHGDLSDNSWENYTNSSEIVFDTYYFINTTGSITKEIPDLEDQVISSYIELMDTGDYNMIFKDGSVTLLNLSFSRNNTAFTTQVREENNDRTIVNTSSTSDDLQEIYVEVAFNNDIETATVYLSLVREVLGQTINENIYSLPLSTGTAQSLTGVKYQSNGNNLRIYDISSHHVINSYPVYQTMSSGADQIECSYTTVGCKNIRVWGNDQQIPTYHFYDEYQVCATTLGGETSETPNIVDPEARSYLERVFGADWNTQEKILASIVIILVIIAGFSILAILLKESILVYVGVFLGLISLFYFAIIGFIPVWVIVVMGIVASLVTVSMVRSGFFGTGD